MSDLDSNEPKEEYKDLETNSEQLNNMETIDNSAKDFLYFVFDLLKTGIVVFLIAFGLRYFAIQPFIVDGESMMPNYVNNEYILAEKISYLTGEPKRGDIIVFRYPSNPNVSYIKRIIGVPGDTVVIENSTIKILNSEHPEGIVLDEKYLPTDTLTLATGSSNGAFNQKVEKGLYFVMGDNRQHSSDSREWGFLPESNIIGRAWLTLLPANKFGIQKRITYPELSERLFSPAFASAK